MAKIIELVIPIIPISWLKESIPRLIKRIWPEPDWEKFQNYSDNYSDELKEKFFDDMNRIKNSNAPIIQIIVPDVTEKLYFVCSFFMERFSKEKYKPFLPSEDRFNGCYNIIDCLQEGILHQRVKRNKFFNILKKKKYFIVLDHAEKINNNLVPFLRQKNEMISSKFRSRLVLLYNERSHSDHSDSNIECIVLEKMDPKLDFSSLSPVEQSILCWLTLKPSLSTEDISVIESVRKDDIEKAILSLKNKFLVNDLYNNIVIRDSIKQSVRYHMIDNFVNGVLEKKFSKIDSYSIFDIYADDAEIHDQQENFLNPIKKSMQQKHFNINDNDRMIDDLRTLLLKIKNESIKQKYAVANIVNLLFYIGGNINNMDLSGLNFGPVDFSRTSIINADLRGAKLMQAKFQESLDMVTSCKFLPEKPYFVTGDVSGNIIFWDTKTYQKINSIKAHKSTIWEICFSENGNYMATCSNDSSLKVWNLSQIYDFDVAPERVYVMEEKTGSWLSCADWHNNIIATAGGSGIIYFCDPLEKRIQQAYGTEGTHHRLRFSLTGKILLAGNSKGIIQEFCYNNETREFEQRTCFKAHNGQVSAINFINESEVLSGGEDGNLIVWKKKGDEWSSQCSVQAHNGIISGAVASNTQNNGILIITCGHDGKINKWKYENHNIIKSEEYYNESQDGKIHSMDIGNQKLLTCSADTTVRIWNIFRGCLSTLRGFSPWVNSLALYGNEKFLAAGYAEPAIRIWNTDKKELDKRFYKIDSEIISISVSGDDRLLAAGERNGTIVFYDLIQKRMINRKTIARGSIRSIAFLPGNYRIISASNDESVAIYDIEYNNPNQIVFIGSQKLCDQFNSWLGGLGVNNNGLIAYSMRNGQIQVCKINGNNVCNKFLLNGPKAPLQSIELSNNGKWIAAAGDDGYLYLWNLNQENTMQKVKISESHIGSLCFSNDSKYIAAVGGDGTLKIISSDNPSVIQEVIISKESLHCVKFNGDMTKIFVAGMEGSIYICDIEKNSDDTIKITNNKNLYIDRLYSKTKIFKSDLPRVRLDSLSRLGVEIEEK